MSSEILQIIMIPLLGTIVGSAFVFFIKERIPDLLQKLLLGFAGGVMVAASVWSLLIPSMDMCDAMGKLAVMPAAVGLLLGFGFLHLIDHFTPHLHADAMTAEGLPSQLSKTWKLALAVTIHNLPEGMAVGVVIASALQGNSEISLAAASAVAVGMAIQNIPEGAIVAMPMRTTGNSRKKSFTIGALSGIVEPIGAIITIVLASFITPALPYLLAFAAGAMLYVVVEELIPEASTGKHSNMATVGFAFGFALMMILDVVLS
ncbi:MAG: ZIP family metal transporter [Muribaculaceae bacterium]|nr:ZIP family metal transporter [Muribaculaceae bacterium]